MTRTGRRRTHPPRTRAALLVAAIVALVAAPLAAAALPAGVVMLKGPTSQNVEALFTYKVSARTLNGFSVSYTCRGRKPVNDSDVYTITDGGNDSRRLATVRSNGDVSLNMKGNISRFTEDGQRPRGTGRLILKAKLTISAKLRVLKGTARVVNAKCPSAALTFRSTVKR
jgi:hypothetical protein